MNTYSLWVEGYAATMEHSTAKYLGSVEGENFGEAIQNWYANEPDANSRWGALKYNENTDQWSLWGCRVFETEEEARRRFG